MAHLPASIIRKYGVTKKAWAVFRRGRVSHVHARVVRARHRKNRGDSMARTHKIRSYARGAMRSPLLGSVAYGVIEPTIDALASRVSFGAPSNLVKASAGYLLSKKGGFVGGLGTAMLTIEVYKLARGGFSLGLGSGTTNAVPTYG